MAVRILASGPEIMSTKDNVANTLKTSMSLLPLFIAVNQTGQRGEIAFLQPRGLSHLRPPFGNVLRRDAVQPVKNERVPLSERIRGRR